MGSLRRRVWRISSTSTARGFTPLSQSQMAELHAAAEPVAKQSLFFRFTDRSKG